MAKTTLRRLFIAVSFIFIVELLTLFWIAPGWVSLGSGFLGSLILIIPAARLEFWKASRTRLGSLAAGPSSELQEFKRELDIYFDERIEKWHSWDSSLMIIGGVLLAFYFILQIPYKYDLVSKQDLANALDKLRMEQIDRLREFRWR